MSATTRGRTAAALSAGTLVSGTLVSGTLVSGMLVSGMLAAGAAPAIAAPAYPGEPVFRAESVSITPATVTVSGFDTVPVRVTVIGGFDRPVDENDLWVPLTGTRPANGWGAHWDITARRVSGTTGRGTWVGEVRLPSTTVSPLTVSRVFPASCRWDTMSPCDGSPVPATSVTLTTRHVPVLSTAVQPTPLPVSRGSFDVVGRVLDRDTKKPFGRVARVGLAFDTDCGGASMRGARFVAATDRNGRFRIRVTRSLTSSIYSGDQRTHPKGQGHCVLLGQGLAKTSTQVVGRAWVRLILQPTLTAKPATNTVKAGQTVQVNGLTQDTTRPILLQRKVGRTTWRTVGSAPARISGRFTLTAQPPAKGWYLYRAFQPGNGDILAAASGTFTLVAR